VDDVELLRRLTEFGVPFFVPAGDWVVAGFDGNDAATHGVLVFNDTGSIDVRTQALSQPRDPLSIDVWNVQSATAGGLNRDAIPRVIVDEATRRVRIDGEVVEVRTLESHSVFLFTVEHAGRRLRAAGERQSFDAVAISSCYELRLRPA
jgi:hypothetical protein